MRRNLLVSACLSVLLSQPGHADDLQRLFGTIATEVLKDQMRQQRSQPQPQPQPQPQARQPQNNRQQAQPRAQQPAAPRQQQPNMSLEERKAVQRGLQAEGYYSGEIDGILGSGSRRAIANWQSAHGAAATGYLRPRQAQNLIAAAPAPAPARTATTLDQQPAPQYQSQYQAQPQYQQQPQAQYQAQPQYQQQPQAQYQPQPQYPPQPQWQSQPQSQPLLQAAPQAAMPGAVATILPGTVAGAAAAIGIAEAADHPQQGTAVPPVAGPQTSDTLVGDAALEDGLFIWSVATRPELLSDDGIIWRLSQLGIGHGPRESSGMDPTLRREAARAAMPGPDLPPPGRVLLERDIQIHPAWDGRPAGLSTIFPNVEGAPTITELTTFSRGRSSGAPHWTFRLGRPFYLPPPAGFEAWAIPRQDKQTKLLLQIDLSLSGLVPSTAEGMGYYRGGSGNATVNRVALIRRAPAPRRADDPVIPDEVLHVWTGEAPTLVAAARPSDAAALVATFGGAASGGRFVPRPATTDGMEVNYQALLGGDTAEQVTTAISLRRLVEADPARLPDIELTQLLSRQFLTERERLDLFPSEIAQQSSTSKINELALHAAMTENAAAVRDLAIARAPDLPLALRQVSQSSLREYDFTIGGFPIAIDGSIYAHLPMAQAFPETEISQTLLMPPAEAQQLLERMAQLYPQQSGWRPLFLVVDYSLEDIAPRAPGSGPITSAELGTMRPRNRIEQAALYLDPGLTHKLMDLPVPEVDNGGPQGAADDLGPGEDLYATTGKSLWGAFARADSTGDVTRQALKNLPQVYRGATGGEEFRAAALRDEVLAEARDSYWIGASFSLGAYDPAIGSIPIEELWLAAVPYENDISGLTPPSLRPADPRDLAALSVTPEQAAQIDSLRKPYQKFAAYLQIRPDGALADADGHGPTLTFPRPEVLLLGPAQDGATPRPVAMRIEMTAPPRLGVADDLTVTAPDALLLDREGVDLLALSVDPAIYDDAAWRRMLIERLMHERLFAIEGDVQRGDLPWGRFFANVQLTPQADIVDDLLPAFREWTLARVGALPQDLLLASGQVPFGVQNCARFLDVTAGNAAEDRRIGFANASALLREKGLGLPETLPGHSERPRITGDRVWALDVARGTTQCSYPRQVDADGLRTLIPTDAGHVAALIHAAAAPVLGRTHQDVNGQVMRLKRRDLQLAAAEGTGDAPAGLRGVLVATASVERLTGYRIAPNGGGFEEVASIGPQDWADPVAVPLAANDVVGLTLGMTLEAFKTEAATHLGTSVLFTEEKPGEGVFGHAQGLLNPETGEALAAIYAPHAEGQPVVAIMRRLPLGASGAPDEALKLSLVKKYGEISRDYPDRGWMWGTLPDGEDGWGVCGNHSMLSGGRHSQVPQLAPVEDLGLPENSRRNWSEFWTFAGWPEVVTGKPGQIDPSRCGPVAAASVGDPDGRGRALQVWLVDRKLAEELDAVVKPTPEAADIKL